MDHPSELAELCWNLGSLNQLKAEDRNACRSAHTRFMVMGAQTIAHPVNCNSDLEVQGIRAMNKHHCRRQHLRHRN